MAVDTSSNKWTITGVSPATQKAARAAARQEDMTLGAWIERAVAQAAEVPRGKSAHRDIPNHRPDRRYF